jgi:hypothetical protein
MQLTALKVLVGSVDDPRVPVDLSVKINTVGEDSLPFEGFRCFWLFPVGSASHSASTQFRLFHSKLVTTRWSLMTLADLTVVENCPSLLVKLKLANDLKFFVCLRH